MEILFILIPLGILILAIMVAAFFWAIKSGQFEDMEGPAYKILMDDDDPLDPVQQKKILDPKLSDQQISNHAPKKSE